ncbi:dihydrodipicolinate synthase family protein [soil metagenome]
MTDAFNRFPADTIRGVLPVVQTPFHEDESLDEKTLRREVRWLRGFGVHGLVMAMVSETLRLTDDERVAVAALLVECSDGAIPVIVSVGAESTAQALAHARGAARVGASALMAIPPALARCGPEQLYRHYAALVETCGLPVIVQDASGYLGNSVAIPILVRLLEKYPCHILFKPEALPVGPALTALCEATGGTAGIFEGTGGIHLSGNHRRGVRGTMPGADMAWALMALWEALERGEDERAFQLQAPLTSILSLLPTLDTYLAVEKMLLVEQGVFKNSVVRGPGSFAIDTRMREEILRHFRRLRQACDQQANVGPLGL